ncbi:MAG TPA: transglycosylase SLT domain-containing protein, partial [Solirubrobacteraceae bacterium]|nr:transglycosylase SLT domain-containing protein [Solirubrobacteraceae bacterium]
GVAGTFDPLAYTPARAGLLEQAAADGLSHVLYAKSPGGVLAAARRTAAFRPLVEAAARSGPIDADTLEAIIMLESAGRPDVVAGVDPSAAAGLTQIVAQTGSGLLGMRVDLAASRRLAARIAAAPAEEEDDGEGDRGQRTGEGGPADPDRPGARAAGASANLRGRVVHENLKVCAYSGRPGHCKRAMEYLR